MPAVGMVCHQVGGAAPGDDPAGVDDRDPGAEGLGLLHVVSGVNHGHPLVPEPGQAVEDHLAGLGVDPDGGLVQKEEPGMVDQSGGEIGPPLHSAGADRDPNVGSGAEPHHLQPVGHPVVEGAAPEPVEPAEVGEVFPGRERRVEGDFLGDQAEMAAGLAGMPVQVDPTNRDFAPVRREQGAHERDGGGLAGPVGSQEPDDLPGGHVKVHVHEGRDRRAPIVLVEAPGGQRRRFGGTGAHAPP